MGVRNFLVDGVSGTGKSAVCRELRRRGHHAVDGDNELAYQGDPVTGTPLPGSTHEHHIWDVQQVRALVADQDQAVTFFCGGSRNFAMFIDLFDGVFVLDVDVETLKRRLAERPEDDWGGRQAERDLVVRLHRTREGIPTAGTMIDATAPIGRVVDEIVQLATRTTRATPTAR